MNAHEIIGSVALGTRNNQLNFGAAVLCLFATFRISLLYHCSPGVM